MEERELEGFRRQIRDSGKKVYPWTLYKSATKFCQQALDFPNGWFGKAEVMRRFVEAFPQVWGEFVADDEQTAATLDFLTQELSLALHFIAGAAAAEDMGDILEAERKYLRERIEHYRSLEGVEPVDIARGLHVEMLFLQKFFKTLNEHILQEDESLFFGCSMLDSACDALMPENPESDDAAECIGKAEAILSCFSPRETRKGSAD